MMLFFFAAHSRASVVEFHRVVFPEVIKCIFERVDMFCTYDLVWQLVPHGGYSLVEMVAMWSSCSVTRFWYMELKGVLAARAFPWIEGCT